MSQATTGNSLWQPGLPTHPGSGVSRPLGIQRTTLGGRLRDTLSASSHFRGITLLAVLGGHLPGLQLRPLCQEGQETQGVRLHQLLPAKERRSGPCVTHGPMSRCGGGDRLGLSLLETLRGPGGQEGAGGQGLEEGQRTRVVPMISVRASKQQESLGERG